ncbi:hypothetical protein EXIGLDRAFT_431766 [Exidia glandulosa HHB12029]|uniref:Uncharacterized protein n=1 Tax=Exidia glandulosa HHB12029 TaxID=1314781 RepID=A0A165KGZ9_EXIGL|nr:hypothetical protein EXIGLDRAFT_431766 [Exidia glandulosa HHB12029]
MVRHTYTPTSVNRKATQAGLEQGAREAEAPHRVNDSGKKRGGGGSIWNQRVRQRAKKYPRAHRGDGKKHSGGDGRRS